MKKYISIFLLLFISYSCFAQAGAHYFRSKLDSILRKPLFDSSQIALSVYDITEGKAMFNRNEKQLLRPASTLKILTTAAALHFLKPDYNFKTNLYYEGAIKDSTLKGNLFVEGGFDPELSAGNLEVFTTGIKKLGIKNIEGNIYADISKMDSLFWGKGWMWDDDSDRDFPYMNSLPINKNSIKIITSPGGLGKPVLINTIPETDFVTIINKTNTLEKDSSRISVTRNWVNRKNEIVITGFTGQGSKPDTTEVNIVNPDKYFLSLFVGILRKNNIQLSGKTDTLKTPISAKLISTITHSIKEVIKAANKESDNLNAEMLLRATAYEQMKKKISAKDGTKYIDSLITIAGMKKQNYRIVDGSGVSFYNLISTELVVEVLKYLFQQKEYYQIISSSLPVAGVDGTLANRLKDFSHLQNINAKTGTMSGISTLAGYIFSTHGHVMAFTLYIQNFNGNPKRIRDIQDEICRAIYLIKSDKDE
ncbi:MAG: D-alanyl-D-alanine carboxypeptidase/D-alanyl-D-alanine-endopeptidase [Flavobacterium sp.]|nr:D-alanyl-D-alanine carboxypeptidase/D-alanyl-D-alanine-endopeptidase [Flavobacterium sp.]